MNKIGIIGLGLIGGSIAKALKYNDPNAFIVAMDSHTESLQQALNEKVIDHYTTTLDSSFSSCHIIFFCTPVQKMMDLVPSLLPFISSQCIITDVGSTKKTVMECMKQYQDRICFIGGHPMAGSEKTGYAASKHYLFQNAYYILTPFPFTPLDQLQKLTDVISSLGALPITIEPTLHDFITASISHVPHVIAAALVHMVKELDTEKGHMKQLAAGGFKDITRIASSSPDMWSQICMTNTEEILQILSKMKEKLSDFENILINRKEKELWDFFYNAQQYRNEFSSRNPGPFIKSYEIVVDIVDQPGVIATLATLLSKHHINIKNIGIISNREFENGVLQIIFETQEDQKQSIDLLQQLGYQVYPKE